MDTNKKWRIAMMPLALAGVALIPLQGCDEIQEAQQSVCCSEFTPGADLAAVEWGLEGDAELRYGAFMQAVSDFTGVGNAIVTDVANACQAIAVDLGEDPGSVAATQPDQRARQWCDAAVKGIGQAGASLKINFQPPSCSVNAQVQANCEAKCSANAECKITPAEIIARCDPGQLSVRCEGGCNGSCEGSANLGVECKGTCQGTCRGKCQGQCSATNAMGDCDGACDGACDGECRGSCKVDANAQVDCKAECTGGCMGMATAPKCKGELKPPKAECNVEAKCGGSCEASASAKAECREGSIEISGSGNVDRLIATLKVNLPKLLVVVKGRGEAFVANAEAIANATADLEVTGSVKAGACLIPAGAAMVQAAANTKAGFEASGKVLAAVNIGP